eukprot:GDKI01033468.1.p2 GENE.GDKI01033468.1~~GDKI01033468.1.p2  ORF type:complete len:147 (-),score=56.41 GDKI01033468.1:43-483(-)
MSSNDREGELLKSIKVKHGVLKRIRKELLAYRKEEVNMREKVQKMKDENKDPHDIRQQENVLGETLMMIPDSARRLKDAYLDMEGALPLAEQLAGPIPEVCGGDVSALTPLQQEVWHIHVSMNDARETLPELEQSCGAAAGGDDDI